MLFLLPMLQCSFVSDQTIVTMSIQRIKNGEANGNNRGGVCTMGSSRQRLEWKMGSTIDANDGMHTSWGGARVCEACWGDQE